MPNLAYLLLLLVNSSFAADLSAPPTPDGLPNVSRGKWAVISRDQLPRSPLTKSTAGPKTGERFKTAPYDRVINDDGGWVIDFDRYPRMLKAASDVLPKSSIDLMPLEGTTFDEFTLLGYVPDGSTPHGTWTAIARVFTAPDSELVVLREWDFGLDDGGVLLLDDMLNSEVGRVRATVIETHTGSVTQTLVSWITGTRKFELIAACRKKPGCASPDKWRTIAGTIPTAPVSTAMKPAHR